MKRIALSIILLIFAFSIFGCAAPAIPERTTPTTVPQTTAQTTVPETTVPETTVATTPETQPVETLPMNDVPYTTKLSGATMIYRQPDGSSTFVREVGEDGIYTIVEEAYDSHGNLWGKLKSGLGWVILQVAGNARTCIQCGKSDPVAFFAEDWKPGELCHDCTRDEFHGGRVYCPECGADCTYRGLEENGRCEDCQGKKAPVTGQINQAAGSAG